VSSSVARDCPARSGTGWKPPATRLAAACLAAASLLSLLAGCVSIPAEQPKKTYTSIAFSPDQTMLALANAHEISVIDADSWQHINTLRALPPDSEGADLNLFRHGVGDSMVFLDNARIASTGMGGLVSIWDARSGGQLAVIDSLPEEEFASTIDYSDVSRRMAIGTSAGRIFLTTLENQQVGPLVSHVDTVGHVWDLQFSRDGKYLASASQVPPSSTQIQTTVDPSVEAAESWAQAHVSETPAAPNVIIWDAASLSQVGELEGATHVLRMALVPGQQALLTVGSSVDLWTFLTQEQLEEVSDPSMVAQGIAVGTIAVFSVVSLGAMTMSGLPSMTVGEYLLSFPPLPVIPTTTSLRHACARAAAISPDGLTIVSTTRGPNHNVMAVIDRTNNQVIEKWRAGSSICDMQFSPDGKYLVAATSGGVFLFDTTSWKKTDIKDLAPGKSSD